MENNQPFHILALDGGGIKGIFSAAVLAWIEDDCQISISEHFDLIAGTSTGGVIALALGLGLKPREILEFYISHRRQIFRNVGGLRWCMHWFRHKFPVERFQAALQECFGEQRLAVSRKRLVIPCFAIGEDDVYIFRTPHHPRLARDYKVPVWQIALATTAAPTYFRACNLVDGVRLIDGGVWANNPTMVALVEAVGTLNADLRSIRILSLGTCDDVVERASWLDWGGKLHWAKSISPVFLRGQTLAAKNQAAHLLGKDPEGNDRLLRVSPKVPDGLFALDKVNAHELLAKAAHESRIMMPTFRQIFAPHKASPYVPEYR